MKEETLNDIGFSVIEKQLLKHGLRISNLCHMTGFLKLDLIKTTDNLPINAEPGMTVTQKGTVTIIRDKGGYTGDYLDRHAGDRSVILVVDKLLGFK